MKGTLLALLVLVATPVFGVDGPTDYATAYKTAKQDNKPMLVLVTARWCPPCQTMKTSVIPDLMAKDAFQGFHFATVDYDEESELAKKLIGERGIPQLIIYQKVDGEWVRRYMSGIQTVASVEAFIDEANIVRTAVVAAETAMENK